MWMGVPQHLFVWGFGFPQTQDGAARNKVLKGSWASVLWDALLSSSWKDRVWCVCLGQKQSCKEKSLCRCRRGVEKKQSRGRQKIPESHAQGLKFALVGIHACEIESWQIPGLLTGHRTIHFASQLYSNSLLLTHFLFFIIIINFMAFVCFNFIS